MVVLAVIPASLGRLPNGKDKIELAAAGSRLGPATLLSDDGDRQRGM